MAFEKLLRAAYDVPRSEMGSRRWPFPGTTHNRFLDSLGNSNEDRLRIGVTRQNKPTELDDINPAFTGLDLRNPTVRHN
jgi:hypothetical protein